MNGVIPAALAAPVVSEEADRRPVITCAGELEVFSSLEDQLSAALPLEACEWRRSLGRPARNVHIDVRFMPFSPEALPKDNQWDLIRYPLFHVYWTECMDVDTYKASVRDDIELWLKELNARNISDWLIVVVETVDVRRANKLLPRSTVLDRIRSEWASRQGDRCVSVLAPAGRAEHRAADSWRGLVARVRYLMLLAVSRAIARLEEHVRAQRERRTEPGWHFLRYFRLQEELARALAALGLHDEALVQYDELDALLSQFVVNAHAGDPADWLCELQRPSDRWRGLCLPPPPPPAEGEAPDQTAALVEQQPTLPEQPTLLELRAYLFERQAAELLAGGRACEVAARCLPFLHAAARELRQLDVRATVPGAEHCWSFLAALEVLHACEERAGGTDGGGAAERCSLHTASLWEHAARRLRRLGELCGLLPGAEPTSEQLHLVVGLSAGMGDRAGRTPQRPSPTDKLKEALCSRAAFNRHYLELSELAMGTYKHAGRLRSARLVGRELASFYRLLGETQKAAAFLGDALRTFEQDDWRELAAHAQLELAACHREAGDWRGCVRACIAVAAAPDMDTLVRCRHFDEVLRLAGTLERPLLVSSAHGLRVLGLASTGELRITQGAELCVELGIESSFPREVVCTAIVLSLDRCDDGTKTTDKTDNKKTVNDEAINAVVSGGIMRGSKAREAGVRQLRVQRHLDHRQDRQLASANVVCRGAPLRRADSGARPSRTRGCEELRTAEGAVLLTPGANSVPLRWTAGAVGRYAPVQVCVELGRLEFVSPLVGPRVRVSVRREEPSVRLDSASTELLAGLPQRMLLTVTVGSYPLEPDSTVRLRCSKGMTMRLCEIGDKKDDDEIDDEGEGSTELSVRLDGVEPYARTLRHVRVLCELSAREQCVQVSCPWSGAEPLNVPLGFTAPLTAQHRLHTARHRKFVQLLLTGHGGTQLHLHEPACVATGAGAGRVCFQDLNPSKGAEGKGRQPNVISGGLSLSYMWEMVPGTCDGSSPFRVEFTAQYALETTVEGGASDENGAHMWRTFRYNFELSDYETLYLVEARVEPSKGSEFCRVGALCHLRLIIKAAVSVEPKGQKEDGDCRSEEGEESGGLLSSPSLMYEVLAEQSVWAVCGRTAGVVSVAARAAPQLVTLDVMPLASGYLPLPLVRLSRYVPASRSHDNQGHPRLEPFSPGQVYNGTKGRQVHVLPQLSDAHHLS